MSQRSSGAVLMESRRGEGQTGKQVLYQRKWSHVVLTTYTRYVERMKVAWFEHVTRRDTSSKLSFRAPWKVDDAVVGRGNAGWTTSKSGHLCPCQNCSQGPPAEKTGGGSLLNRPSCPPDDQIGKGTELN